MHVGTLAARTLGRDGPAIVLLHGLAGSNRYWGSAYDDLAGAGRLVVPDLLGFGASPRPPSGYGPRDHADALATCLAEIGVDEPVVVAGHSLGALVALALAANHPALVQAVVGFGPPLFRNGVDAAARVRHLGITGRLFALPGPVAHTACRWMCAHRGAAASLAAVWRPGMPGAIARDGVQHSWASYSETMRDVILDPTTVDALRTIRVPVRLVAGDRDPLVDSQLLTALAARHGNISFERWPGGDHDLPLTHPERCAAVILETVAATGSPSTPAG